MSGAGCVLGRCFGLVMATCLLGGCGGDGQGRNPADHHAALPAQERPIAPDEFVFVPCAGVAPESGCLIIAAGGKRVLVGAPAGIGAGRIAGETLMPDGVILTLLEARQIEGLDEVRNAVWLSGRRAGLTVSGDAGVGRFVAALNEAYEISDALAYVDGERRGGFSGQAMVANVVENGGLAFDTGDLQIKLLGGVTGELALLVSYNKRVILLAGCGDILAGDPRNWPIADAYIGCETPNYPAEWLGAWPLSARVYVD